MSAQHEATRAALAALPERCHPRCKGWGVFMSSDRGWEIERCDECCRGTAITDDDVAALPEAQAALTDESGSPLRCRYLLPWQRGEGFDCTEDHPFAQAGLPVTCPTCCGLGDHCVEVPRG